MKNFKHEKFIYKSYKIEKNYNDNGGKISFHFIMDEYEFKPEWTFSFPIDISLDDELLRQAVFSLGMTELISYWKAACPPLVEVHCGTLDEWQVKWWKKLYKNGLGEFFYKNKIETIGDFMKINSIPRTKNVEDTGINLIVPEKKQDSADYTPLSCLIPVGGGKDSIVTLELLGKNKNNNCCYIIGDIKRARDCAKVAGYDESQIITVKRTIDPTLIELNKKGYLNGHTPFSAIVAFSSLVFGYISGRDYIVLSNESSANEGNVKDSDVNHQYSKSTEFEKDFREYVEYISHNKKGKLPRYFSLLRPWNEFRITQEFTKHERYFDVFQSCNVGTKTNTWCCKCAKCLYVYIMLSAFLDDDALIKIFGENLLKNPELREIFIALFDSSYDKPFECVGTRSEIMAALSLSAKKRTGDLPLLLLEFVDKMGDTLIEANSKNALELINFFDGDNFIPVEFLKLLT